MTNIINYLYEEKRSFEEYPLNEIDSLILCQFSYISLKKYFSENLKRIHFSDLSYNELSNDMFNKLNKRDGLNNINLLLALAANPRFNQMIISDYVDIRDTFREEQFSASSYILNDELTYIAFRGTDASILGWKEDFNMTFSFPVPAQKDALKYLLENCKKHRKIIIGGHSKGGNLAEYAYVKSPEHIQSKILKLFNHDGPGFKENSLSEEEFEKLANFSQKTVPECGIIGNLLISSTPVKIVESKERWILQHDPYSWIIENGKFKEAKKINRLGRISNKSLYELLSSLEPDRKEKFINIIYKAMIDLEIPDINYLFENFTKLIPQMNNKFKDLDKKEKDFMDESFKILAYSLIKSNRKKFK